MKFRSSALFLLISVFLFAYQSSVFTVSAQKKTVQAVISKDDYSREWAKVDSLISAGLPKSALDIVNYIYKDSKVKNRPVQLLKAVIYKLRLGSEVEEDFMVKSIDTLKNELRTSTGNTSAILHSMLAELYWSYYQANRYTIIYRTETSGIRQDDLRTWDARMIVQQVIAHYQASLKSPAELQKVNIEDYSAVLFVYDSSENFRPTLFDFLAYRAVDFFSNSEAGLTQPVNKFEMRDGNYFSRAEKFIKINIATTDTFSLKYYAVRLLQDVLAFHLYDKNPQALIDADLIRLKFVNKNSLAENKDSLYLAALADLEQRYIASPYSANVTYEIALTYTGLAAGYKPLTGNEHKWDNKTALDHCKNAIARFPQSEGANNCRVLQNQILAPAITMNTEDANLPGKPFRTLVTYKNTPELFLRIVKVDPGKNRRLLEEKYGEELISQYLKMDAVKEWSLKMPDDGDFQQHTTEIILPELPEGLYVLIAAGNKGFTFNDKIVAWSSFWITRISYINRQKADGSLDFYVMDRASGVPLKNVKVQTYSREYNYNTRKYDYNKFKSFLTDDNGYFEVPPYHSGNYDYHYIYADFELDKDNYSSNNYFYQYPDYSQEEKPKLQTSFFLDRAIYRPGQSIYFKGILLQKTGDKYAIKPNYAVTATLYDVNYQKVSDLYLVTNDYGTYNGTFTAPSSGLTGQMYITDTYGTVYFSVEEYKRPKFEVKFEPVKGTYKLNDKVTVTGIAKAYAGNALDGAQVKYRVVRTARFPYWGYWWDWYCPSSPDMEIKNGDLVTDENGRYTIEFTALPDLSVSQKYKPVFDYSVYADVTDINGETHSSSTYISVGYTALLVSVSMPATVDRKAKNEFNIYTTNFSGVTEHTDVSIKVWSLRQPDHYYRDRLWAQPDKYTMTKEEFAAAFPNDVYADENNMYKWEKEKEWFSESYNTGKDSVLRIDFNKWQSGLYMLEITAKDKYGTEVNSRNYFTAYATDDKQIPSSDLSWYSPIKTSGDPGETASFLLGTSDKALPVLYETEFNGKIIKKEWVTLSNELKRFDVPILPEYKGNFTMHMAFVKDNRFKYYDCFVSVPYTEQNLDLEFETFRDKLQPGQDEEWHIIVKGSKGEKVAAEMVATLYDASLDQFRQNYWYLNILNYSWSQLYWDANHAFTTNGSNYYLKKIAVEPQLIYHEYNSLNWRGFYVYGPYHFRYSKGDMNTIKVANAAEISYDGAEREDAGIPADEMAVDKSATGSATTTATLGVMGGNAETRNLRQENGLLSGEDGRLHEEEVQIRKNFNETAFFYPNLMTNEKGEVVIKFKVPEALTRWKMMGLAHTRDLKFGQISKEVVTQKELMVVPNQPRFFRDGDTFIFTAKVSDVSDKDLTGEATLQFFDAVTMKPLDAMMKNTVTTKPFSIKQRQSTALNWAVFIPSGISAITYRITAKAGKFSDGEEMAIPVLTNRMLVTETLPLPVNGNQKKLFTFDKLMNSGSSTTLINHKLTLEFSSNPAWYAVQALPYLMEYPYECSEQVFERYYANSIASFVANSHPRIKQVFDTWKNFTPDALLSNLEKNQELKSLVLEETPWVLDSKSETERKQRIALLFDLNKMSNELESALIKLAKKQASNGGWAWFDGMPDDRYITQFIITGFGHLDHLGIKNVRENSKVWNMVNAGVRYLDDRIREDYEYVLKWYPKDKDKNHISFEQIQYLYARSYFRDIPVDNKTKDAFDYYKGQATKYWNDFGKYMQGMIALALQRYEEKDVPQNIIKSLKETALHSEEMGMYWRDMQAGYYWYEAPVETQALLIECFDEVAQDKTAVDEMKIWLLKQKQTQGWKTTTATAEACYALLLKGTDFLASDKLVEIQVGAAKIDPMQMDNVKVEAGTGYFKTSWSGSEIRPEMGTITVTKTDDGIAWGAMYWQYFEQLDKITPATTPLKLEKKLFVQHNTPTGPVMSLVTDTTKLKVGDKLKVRIELRVDRDMQYVHMKDMRASGFEPTNVISQYKYQDGLGYYESTRDAATNFFFSYLPKGTYVFEYPMFITNSGDFSNGVTTIQCMYAPEFTSHSEGIRVKVE